VMSTLDNDYNTIVESLVAICLEAELQTDPKNVWRQVKNGEFHFLGHSALRGKPNSNSLRHLNKRDRDEILLRLKGVDEIFVCRGSDPDQFASASNNSPPKTPRKRRRVVGNNDDPYAIELSDDEDGGAAMDIDNGAFSPIRDRERVTIRGSSLWSPSLGDPQQSIFVDNKTSMPDSPASMKSPVLSGFGAAPVREASAALTTSLDHHASLFRSPTPSSPPIAQDFENVLNGFTDSIPSLRSYFSTQTSQITQLTRSNSTLQTKFNEQKAAMDALVIERDELFKHLDGINDIHDKEMQAFEEQIASLRRQVEVMRDRERGFESERVRWNVERESYRTEIDVLRYRDREEGGERPREAVREETAASSYTVI